MTRYLSRISGFILLAAGLVLGACEGDTGPQGLPGVDGADGLGFVPMPAADQALGEYDSNGTPVDSSDDPPGQELAVQVDDSTGVWEVTLDHQVQIDRGDGTPPVIASSVLVDTDTDDVWLVIDGQPVALTFNPAEGGSYQSIGCNVGVPLTCVEVRDLGLVGDFAEVRRAILSDLPETATAAFAVFGVKTAAADLPATGTANYGPGEFRGRIITAGVPNFTQLQGDALVDVTFDPAGSTVTFDSSGSAITAPGSPVANTAYSLIGEGTLDGNSYSGTLTTATFDADTTAAGGEIDFRSNLDPDTEEPIADDLFSGTLYGPAPDAVDDASLAEPTLILESETAGVVEATNGTDSLIGGFISEQSSFTPPPPPAPAAE